MHRSQADRAVIARRAAENSVPRNRLVGARASTNILLRPQTTLPSVFGPGGRVSKVRYSGSGEQGYRSAWTGSMDFYTDARWSQTVTSQHA